MQRIDLTSGLAQIQRAAAQLKEQWGEAKSVWNDEPSRTFQEDFLQPLLPELRLTVTAIQRLAEVLVKAEKECQDEGI